jgi:ADP-heptose:LPS heptosyltransferase
MGRLPTFSELNEQNKRTIAPAKYILTNFQSPGDLLMLSAAIRDLHQQYPGRFLTDVRTSSPALWENNPWLTPLDEHDPEVEVLECSYPLIHQSNQLPYHFIHGFIEFFNHTWDLQLRPGAFRGDVHLSEEERAWMSQVEELTGDSGPFWIMVAGGKFDFTTKWWDFERYQAVVDHFFGKIRFVQVGMLQHYHPPLERVLDLRGKTDLRQLVRLCYHASGVITPVSLMMHLAAAVPAKPGLPFLKPCVVISGGREPVHWEAYPGHQFIHTIGALPCCAHGGCWKSRVKPLGDGDDKDLPENLCLDPVGLLPRCMDMIPAEEVIRRVELYYAGGVL